MLVIEEGAQFQGHCVLAGSETVMEPEEHSETPETDHLSGHNDE